MERNRGRGQTIAQRTIWSVALVAGLTAWLTYASSHAYAANADGATVVLEGAAVTHGQLLLHGWSLSLDSFWSVDVPFYALGVAIRGVGPLLMHLVPALLVALSVLVGVALTWSGACCKQRVYASALLVLTLCLPDHTAAFYLLQGPWHVATTLYCLVAALMLARTGFGWRWSVAVILLALGLNGDLQMLAFGVVPIALAGLLAMARGRALTAGLTQILAASASCLLAILIRVTTVAIGTFSVTESHHTVSLKQLLRDIPHFGSWITAIFGIHNGAVVGPRIPLFVEVARSAVFALVILGVVLALVGVVLGVVRPQQGVTGPNLPEGSWRIDDLLLCMTLGAIGLFGLLTLSDNTSYARYLDPVVIFAAILAARVLPRFVDRFSNHLEQVVAPLMALAVGLCLFSSVQAATETTPAAPTARLESYLLAHHLTLGIGDYWAASIVTVDTKDRIIIRPVVANLQREIVPDGRQADLGWYTGEQFQFLVSQRKPYGLVNFATMRKTFGPPVNIVRLGSYYVATWSHPLTLSPHPYP